MKKVISFAKRYSLFVIAVVVAGNILIWQQNRKFVPHYEASVKFRVKGHFYDKTREVLDRFSAGAGEGFEFSPKVKDQLLEISTESYRNEDIYIIQLNLNLRDTTGFNTIAGEISNAIMEQEYLRRKYFSRVSKFDSLIAYNEQLQKRIGTDTSDQGLLTLYDLKTRQVEMNFYRDQLVREFELIMPTPKEVRFVDFNAVRQYAKASFIFLLIGMFLAVIVDHLRTHSIEQ